ncbi:hypothetical protein BGZ94_003742 [Podila epigama]|nr:hypothetical protein BGZ94_003742 [Podila epigama]
MDNTWEKFGEAIAALLAKALTNKEAESVIASVDSFRDRLHRLSSHNLEQLNLQLTQNKKRANNCQHEGKTCQQNVTRGFFKTWVIAYLVKYGIGVIPAILTAKILKK